MKCKEALPSCCEDRPQLQSLSRTGSSGWESHSDDGGRTVTEMLPGKLTHHRKKSQLGQFASCYKQTVIKHLHVKVITLELIKEKNCGRIFL